MASSLVEMQAEMEKLRDRLKRLAADKSQMQLVSELLTELAPLTGLREVAKCTLQFLMNSIGGVNISIYYIIDSRWHCLDVYGRDEHLDEPDLAEVRAAIEKKHLQRSVSNAEDVAPLTIYKSQSTFTSMAFPLVVGEEVYGALYIEGVLIHLEDEIVNQLQFLANYISLVVRNETLNESRLKMANDALKQKNAQLENEIRERKKAEEKSRQLNEELMQSRKMEAIGTMAGGIAHDFNNLLGAIMGFSELAQDAVESESIKKYLDQVLVASDRAKELVSQILTFSRKQATNVMPLNPTPVVKEVMKLLRATVPTSIIIETEIQSNVGYMMGDVTRLHQIVMNLCTNARHAMIDASGVMTVRLFKSSLNEKPAVALSVKDNGCGISPELLNRIFEPYFTTKEVGKGTGMGLSVVHGIVRSFGGTISVSSTPGVGSVFTCLFPAVAASQTLQEPASHRKQFSGRLMLVDDDSQILLMASEMLRKLGFEVTAFSDPVVAFAHFNARISSDAKAFDLVISDQTMPKMSGIQLARGIAEVSRVPVMLFSGYSDQLQDKTRPDYVKAIGAKPYTIDQLSRLIQKVLGSENVTDG